VLVESKRPTLLDRVSLTSLLTYGTHQCCHLATADASDLVATASCERLETLWFCTIIID